jgi:LacI family transcriptional regulator
MATIKDVAEAANVSLSTVSHVLNGTRPVLPQTAARVKAAMAQLGYVPNNVAQSLKNKKTRTVGMILSSTSNPLFGQVLHGIEEECFRHGYSLILCNTQDTTDRYESYLRTLLQKRVDALILMTTGRCVPDIDLLANFADVPKVAVFARTTGADLFIGDNSYVGGRLAAEYLIRTGARRLGCIQGDEKHALSKARLKGYREAAHEAGIEILDHDVQEGDWSMDGGFRAMNVLLGRLGNMPDAIFAMNDMMAIGALSAAHRRGVKVPENVSMLGYDGIQYAQYSVPALSTLGQDGIGIGQRATSLLIEHLENGVLLPQEILVPPRIVERQTTWREFGAARPVDDTRIAEEADEFPH